MVVTRLQNIHFEAHWQTLVFHSVGLSTLAKFSQDMAADDPKERERVWHDRNHSLL
jgi:hypothetical protein